MKKNHLIPMLLLLAALSLAACHSHTLPEGVLDAQQMEDCLYDAYQLESFYSIENGGQVDDLAPEIRGYYQELYSRHGITAEQFSKSLDYYHHHIDLYEPIHQRVVDRLKELAQ